VHSSIPLWLMRSGRNQVEHQDMYGPHGNIDHSTVGNRVEIGVLRGYEEAVTSAAFMPGPDTRRRGVRRYRRVPA
jgi:hypothetical protein